LAAKKKGKYGGARRTNASPAPVDRAAPTSNAATGSPSKLPAQSSLNASPSKLGDLS